MDDERSDLIICGRTIGTSTDWDGDQECMVFYNFISTVPDIQSDPEGCSIDWDTVTGMLNVSKNDDNGTVVSSYKMSWTAEKI